MQEQPKIIYSTDKGFNPHDKIMITVKMKEEYKHEDGKYKFIQYRPETSEYVELVINNIEAFWILNSIEDLFKQDIKYFDKILLNEYKNIPPPIPRIKLTPHEVKV